ncbi:hypothetical protein MKW98_024932 [Papaver atlanticum]|uniref:Aminotransferase-like plant mobile domain-containing protein n=1 Tax=Papaver atlanticum TaxID=357466 RepID=A0AAD4XRR2_9MAGN|nr:hypothetical protein MKW98_024932 [Papaver atlanticum]
MSTTTRKMGGKRTNKKKRPSGDVPVESAAEVVDYGVYEGGGNECLPSNFRPNLHKYTSVVDKLVHFSHDIDFVSSDSPYQHRGSLRSIISTYKIIQGKCPQDGYIIKKAGWDRILNMSVGETSHALIDYLVERWWDTTQNFHFPFGEMGFMPLDWIMLAGISIGVGRRVPYKYELYKFDYWTCDAITLKFLKEYFKPAFLSSVCDNVVLIEKVTRPFFMYFLGTFFFSNARNYIDTGWLAAFGNVNDVGNCAWGGYAFSYLYMSLNFSSRKMKSLNRIVHILEFWGYEYLGICRQTPNLPPGADPDTICPRPSR